MPPCRNLGQHLQKGKEKQKKVILSWTLSQKHNALQNTAHFPLVCLSTAAKQRNRRTPKRRCLFFFCSSPFFSPSFPIILNHQGVKYNKALYHSICRLYLTGVLQVNIPLAGEKWAYLKQTTLMNFSSWASITLFQLASPAKHGYPTQICLTEGKIFSNSLCSQRLAPPRWRLHFIWHFIKV